MKTIATLFAAATLLTSAAAFAAEPTAADVGRFVYDQQGEIVGGLTAIGQGSATVSDGLMFHPGFHLVSIPASALSVQAGRVVLTGMTAADLDAQPAANVAAR
ncbi:MAG TPA: hypothetical protein VJY39_13835 [Acidisphaera sp.]|nr:hypothetical protein [Acidisphaera sp.]